MHLRFGQFTLKHAERLVLGAGGPLVLSSRSVDILAKLLASPDEVVSKDALFDAAWPGLTVEDNTLQVHVSALRKVLDPGMIVTVHGRGYRYAGPRPSALDVGQATPPLPAGSASRSDYKPVIAILPFADMSAARDQQYFCDGITEDVIVGLSRYRTLSVVSRHSSSRFTGQSIDPRDTGHALGAKYLVEGSVRRQVDKVRITAQLIEAATANYVWAERYDRETDSAVEVQDDLVRRLVSTLAGHVELHVESHARSRATDSLDAYDLWVRANHAFDLWTVDGNRACEMLLRESIARDPQFSRPHASLSFSHIRAAMMAPGSPDIPALEQAALRSAEHAVRLDPADARAHHAVGWSLMFFREFERARSSFATSASLNPNDGSLAIDRALGLAFLGEREAADEALTIAIALNPLGGQWFWSVLAMVNSVAGRYAAAETYFMLGPRDLPEPLAWHAANLAALGEAERASTVMREALHWLEVQWRGPGRMSSTDFLVWLDHNSMLRRPEDRERLFLALPLAEAEDWVSRRPRAS